MRSAICQNEVDTRFNTEVFFNKRIIPNHDHDDISQDHKNW